MGDLCTCWDAINNVLILQHNKIKALFEMSIHVVGHNFNSTLYKHLVGMVSKYALLWIAEEVQRANHVGFDSEHCGCVLRSTHGLPCACAVARYQFGVIPLKEVHVMWTRLSFSAYHQVNHLLSCHMNKNLMILLNDLKRLILEENLQSRTNFVKLLILT